MRTLSEKEISRLVKTAREQDKRPDLSGMNLSEKNLRGAYLSQVYFIGANLSQANLNGANLAGADLSQADLSGTYLRETNLAEAYLNKANLDRADLSGAYLNKAHLKGVDLSQAYLRRAHLCGANLCGANLSRSNLSKVNLSQTDLVWADLSRADLSEADLSEADLSEADLSEANLRGADLSKANLFRANLSGADLSGANLIWADLSDVDLVGANLSQARFNRAKLGEADFSKAVTGLTSFEDVGLNAVRGLDSVEHLGPSTIGIDTLSRSRGQISEAFLRGCGLSDVQIESAKLNNPNLTFDQINTITYKIHELLVQQAFCSCFISYASQDEPFARQLYDDLQQTGIRCWLAPETTKNNHQKIRSTFNSSIRLYDKLLLVLSEHSINSNWLEKEVAIALMEEIRRNEAVLFPIWLDNKITEIDQAWATDIRSSRHIRDFSQWQNPEVYQQSFAQLLQDLAITEEDQFVV